jgi:hypothetical protein
MNITIPPKATKFLPYQHVVTSPHMIIGNSVEITQIQKSLVQKFKSEGVNAYIDNRSVFVMSINDHQDFCVGFYDNTMMIGSTYQSL